MWPLVLIALLQTGCGGCRKDGGDPRALVPSESRLAIVVDSLSEMKGPLAEFLSGIEGSKGLYDLIDVQLGLDLSANDGLEDIGLDRRTSLVLFEKNDAFSLAVGVSYPERFLANVKERIRVFGPSSIAPGTNERITTAKGPPAPGGTESTWSMAWGVTESRIGVVTWVGEGKDAETAWKDATNLPSSPLEKPDHVSEANLWAAGQTQGLDFELPIPRVGSVLKKALMGRGPWSVGVELDADTLRVRAKVPGGVGLSAAAPFLQTKATAVNFSNTFPKNSSLFLRSRVLMEQAGPLLAGALLMLQAEPVYVDRLPVPALASLVDGLTGEFAFAVMGLDEAVQPTSILRSVEHLPSLLQAIHMAVAVEAVDESKAKELYESVRVQAPKAGFKVSTLEDAAFDGIILSKGKPNVRLAAVPNKGVRTYTLLRKGAVLIGLSGQGELQRFLDVQSKKAIALSASATDEHMKAVLSGSEDALAVTLMSTRITRELADKGVPPFFLTVVNSIREVALRAKIEGKQLNIVMEARQ